MINDEIFKLKGGDGSTNLQGKNIVINNGISYEDAKGIALDVFKQNYLTLSEKAAETARSRAEELVNDFLQQIKERKPEAINSMEDPGMQYAIYSAQKEYAKTGDKYLSDMLVDILVERASNPERNLTQIVLDESLKIVPKLTINQINTITIFFTIVYTINSDIKDLNSFKYHLIKNIIPFLKSLSKHASTFQHIEYTGCGNISIGVNGIIQIILRKYTGLFFKGFTLDELKNNINDYESYLDIFTECMHDNSKLQINAINEDTLKNILNNRNIKKDKMIEFTNLYSKYRMTDNEAKKYIEDQDIYMKHLFDICNNSSMKNLNLTSVGIAIAIANIRRKTGFSYDLSMWIK